MIHESMLALPISIIMALALAHVADIRLAEIEIRTKSE
jgi:hypothetical protein